MKSLESAFIYRNLNKNNVITTNIMKLIQDGIPLTAENIDDSLMLISKNFKFPFKHRVLTAFQDGTLKLIYGENSKLPTCLPFFLTKTQSGDIAAIIAANIYGTIDKETNHVKIDPKKLYCMMEAAYVAKLCFINDKQLASRANIIAPGSSIYSLMFARVLNKKFALNIDKNKYHKVLLLSSKFFMINMLGMKDNEMVFNYALKNCPNGNLYTLEEANNALQESDYDDLDKFITALTSPTLGLNLKGLTTQNFLESFINMYEASALLALESFPYFLYNVFSVVNGGYINHQYILEDIVGSNGGRLYNAILNLEK